MSPRQEARKPFRQLLELSVYKERSKNLSNGVREGSGAHFPGDDLLTRHLCCWRRKG